MLAGPAGKTWRDFVVAQLEKWRSLTVPKIGRESRAILAGKRPAVAGTSRSSFRALLNCDLLDCPRRAVALDEDIVGLGMEFVDEAAVLAVS